MHYLTLITAEIPEITEDEQTNEAVKAQIDKLENEKESFPEKSSGILNLLIAACNSIRDEFSRAVASAATDILEPYHCDTENPDYLEFWDKTPELEASLRRYNESLRYYTSSALKEADELTKAANLQLQQSETGIAEYIQSITTAREIRRGYIETVYQYNIAALEYELFK